MPTSRASTPTILQVSECYIKPYASDDSAPSPSIPLTPWDYAMLSVHHIQKGLLFAKPPSFALQPFLDNLKDSLSRTLSYFYPLAGRLATLKTEEPPSYVVYVDCNASPGARFVHAKVDLCVDDILRATYVPPVVQSFFDHHRLVNHDGHSRSLLTIQVTELVDGIFVGCSMNHSLGDGNSFWNFFNSFSQVFQALQQGKQGVPTLSNPPIFDRSFVKQYVPKNGLPYTHPSQFLSYFEAPLYKERIFHLSSESIARLKDRVKSEQKTDKSISSLQAVAALVWRSITRARNLPADQLTNCRLACNNRGRMNPAVSENYFGNCITALRASTTAGELTEANLGWAAVKINEAVAEHKDENVREWLDSWVKSPMVYKIERLFDPCSVMMGSSPRFNKYGVEFGLGKAVGLRSGYAHKFCGKVSLYPGQEGGISMDLETCVMPKVMDAIEQDEDFMAYVS